MIKLLNSDLMASIGLGTWRMGESTTRRRAEVDAVRQAIDMGYRVIDTAEMYGEGAAEEIVGLAIADALRAGDVKRDELFVVSKVYPHNATTSGTIAACERSLARLGLDHLDAYLLHWRGAAPLSQTIEGFASLQRDRKIRHWGVSNFDLDDMQELVATPGGESCVINQIYYSLTSRGPDFELLPWQNERGIVTMAYSPVDQGALLRHAPLRQMAESLRLTAAQLALAWLATRPGVMSIPKSSDPAHLLENLASQQTLLEPGDLAMLDEMFPAPTRRTGLAML